MFLELDSYNSQTRGLFIFANFQLINNLVFHLPSDEANRLFYLKVNNFVLNENRANVHELQKVETSCTSSQMIEHS